MRAAREALLAAVLLVAGGSAARGTPTAAAGESADVLGRAAREVAASKEARVERLPVLEGAVDPETYVLGPGDLLEVVYTGRSQPSERVRVSPSGRINLAPTGPVEVGGLTLAAAERRIRKLLAVFYEETRISLDLLEVRRFRVHVLGHVRNPGAFPVSAARRVSDLVAMQGELRQRTSLRNMVLRRRGGGEIPVDLVRYRFLGDLAANPYLEDGDVLFVPARRESVSVFGRVARPGFIEYRKEDTVDDLIALAGGLDPGADVAAVELRRFDPSDPTATLHRVLDLARGDGALPAEPGDGVYVRAHPDWRRERLVWISGEVRYPGVYAIEKGRETLRSLIARAGGFTEDANPAGTTVHRPGAFEAPEDDPEFLRLQSIPVQEMSDEEYEYLKLRSRQREGLASAILSVHLDDPGKGEELVLRSGDRVEVPRQNLAVDVQGAVKNPGFVPYRPERRVGDYIELAGGKTERARTGQTRVIRGRTGERLQAGLRTSVEPGDLVWVPEKPARSWWRIVRETAAFLAQIGTLVVIINSANN